MLEARRKQSFAKIQKQHIHTDSPELFSILGLCLHMWQVEKLQLVLGGLWEPGRFLLEGLLSSAAPWPGRAFPPASVDRSAAIPGWAGGLHCAACALQHPAVGAAWAAPKGVGQSLASSWATSWRASWTRKVEYNQHFTRFPQGPPQMSSGNSTRWRGRTSVPLSRHWAGTASTMETASSWTWARTSLPGVVESLNILEHNKAWDLALDIPDSEQQAKDPGGDRHWWGGACWDDPGPSPLLRRRATLRKTSQMIRLALRLWLCIRSPRPLDDEPDPVPDSSPFALELLITWWLRCAGQLALWQDLHQEGA